LKLLCRLHLFCYILILTAACAVPTARFKAESELILERVRVSGFETLLPSETMDFYRTVNQGDLEYSKGNVQAAEIFIRMS